MAIIDALLTVKSIKQYEHERVVRLSNDDLSIQVVLTTDDAFNIGDKYVMGLGRLPQQE